MSRWEANGGSVFLDTREFACCLRPGNECCGEPAVIGDYHEIAQCSEEHAPLIAAAPDMRDAIIEADGCFEAALCEGWIDALADGDIDRIRDIWDRRLSLARSLFPEALAKAGAQS